MKKEKIVDAIVQSSEQSDVKPLTKEYLMNKTVKELKEVYRAYVGDIK